MAVIGEPPLEVNLRFTSDNGEDDSQAIQSLGFSSEAELDRAVNEALTTWIPRAMFVLACHVFAVLFGVQAIAVAIGYVSGNTVVKSVRRSSVSRSRSSI